MLTGFNTGAGYGVGVGGSGVDVGVGVELGVSVCVGVNVGVGVGVGVRLGVGVDVGIGEGVSVTVGVGVRVGLGVLVGVGVTGVIVGASVSEAIASSLSPPLISKNATIKTTTTTLPIPTIRNRRLDLPGSATVSKVSTVFFTGRGVGEGRWVSLAASGTSGQGISDRIPLPSSTRSGI